MSETNTRVGREASSLPPLPNWSARPLTLNVNGEDQRRLEVTYGEPARTLQVRKLGMEDMFDLTESIGGANESFINMCVVAASVCNMDGLPEPFMEASREHIRDRVKRLGADGMRAAVDALNDPVWATPPGSVQAAVKNS